MTPTTMSCRRGYKYQLAAPWALVVSRRITPSPALAAAVPAEGEGECGNEWVHLRSTVAGIVLEFAAGYAWDGASGPMPDFRSVMRAALAHDGMYQLLREGHLPAGARADADRLLYALCRADGMARPLAWLVYHAVRRFAAYAARRGAERRPETYPR